MFARRCVQGLLVVCLSAGACRVFFLWTGLGSEYPDDAVFDGRTDSAV